MLSLLRPRAPTASALVEKPTSGDKGQLGKERLDWLDAMRGVAALTVALFHLVTHYQNKLGIMSDPLGKAVVTALTDYIDLGKFGVVVFFCISGYIIPKSLKNGDATSLKSFAIGRFFRLYPLYWLSIALFFVWPGDDAQPYTALAVLANLTMVQNYLGFTDLRGVYWTLQIELVFYVACMILARLGQLQRAKTLLIVSLMATGLALAMAGARFGLGIGLPVALPMALAVMFWTSLRAQAAASRPDPAADGYARIALGAFLAALLPICMLAYKEEWRAYAISYAAAVAVFVFMSRIRVRSRAMVFVGVVSYSLYLMHQAVFGLLTQIGAEAVMLNAIGRAPTIILSLIIAVGIAAATYYAVEAPFLHLGNILRRSIVSGKAAAFAPQGRAAP